MERNEIMCKSNSHFSFLIGDESPYIYNTNNFFFHSKEFLKGQEVVSFYILNNKKKLCEGVFNLSVREHIGYSPLKAPFGSIDVNSSISPVIIDEFLDIILSWSEDKQLNRIDIKHYPQCYDPEGSAIVQNILFNKGFEISNLDIAQYIDLRPSLDKPFLQSEINRRNKCVKNGFTWERIENCRSIEVYEIIKSCKDRKGYPTTISVEELDKKVTDFPDKYFVFGVKDGQKLIAVAICIAINKRIIYDFMHGHIHEYDSFSPVVFLIDGIYKYSLTNSFEVFDLGLSTDKSIINSGLYLFKSRLGTKPSLKFSFIKKFN